MSDNKLLLFSFAAALMLTIAGCAKEANSPSGAGSRGGGTEQQEQTAQNNNPDKKKDRSSGDEGDASSNDGPGATVLKVSIAGGKVRGPAEPVVSVGDAVRIVVSGDTRDEVHLHGYDVAKPIVPGKRTEIAFAADIPGVFEVELEEAGVPLFELTVE
ncbi:MAG: hypothetical protein H0U16_06765 [Actinobacteria bacterium]|nr:hypothetical protein [Actinomycetota bacterium]